MSHKNHVIAANEGNALAIATGYHLATKKIPIVYLQNSGLGNLINPLTSIAHKNVYSIPMVFLIGWRGYPNSKDEAQHFVMGKITTKILKLMNVKYKLLSNLTDLKKINLLVNYSKKNNVPVAILVRQKILKDRLINSNKNKIKKNSKRIDYIDFILKNISKNSKLFSTTGYTSRELFYLNNKNFDNKFKCFYNVGGMGHTSSIALGYSIKSSKQIICLDGDGSLLMHMGALINITKQNKKNFKHILFNNYSHESVGGQPTLSPNINFKKMTKSLKYKNFYYSKDLKSFKRKFLYFIKSNGPSFFEVCIKPGTIDNLTRPKKFLKVKKNFCEN